MPNKYYLKPLLSKISNNFVYIIDIVNYTCNKRNLSKLVFPAAIKCLYRAQMCE